MTKITETEAEEDIHIDKLSCSIVGEHQRFIDGYVIFQLELGHLCGWGAVAARSACLCLRSNSGLS